MRKSIFILLVAFSVWGCKSQQKEIVKEDLQFTLLPVSSLIGLPIQIMVGDSVLFVNDFYGDTLVHCISLQTGNEVAKWGIRGDGPHEVMSPLRLLKTSDSLFAFSRPLWTLYSVEEGQRVNLKKKMTLPTDVSLLFPLGNSAYLASGMFSDKRFCLLDDNGKEKMRFGDYPCFWNRESDLPIEVKRMFHQIRGYGFSDKHGFVVADSHVLSLYKSTAYGYMLEKEILLASYEYNFKEKGMESIAKLKPSFVKGVVDLAVSDKFIYVLFDNNISGGSDKTRREIWRYDWDGNLLNKYLPNVDLAFIAISSERGLIGLTRKEETEIAFASEAIEM